MISTLSRSRSRMLTDNMCEQFGNARWCGPAGRSLRWGWSGSLSHGIPWGLPTNGWPATSINPSVSKSYGMRFSLPSCIWEFDDELPP